jgi:release factor glutamine methyltransferase
MNIQQIPEHELARLREKAKEITGSQSDYHSSYTELLTRRLNGEPLQYIEEYIPFYSIQINVDQRCLIPRPETEFLIELIKNKSDNPKKILDVGTGTGCIALMLKKLYPESKVDACDISLEALDLAKENSEINNLEINLFQSDLLSDIEEVDYDIIVANLPYIPTETLSSLESEVVDYEPLVALDGGVDGLLYINRLIKEIEEKDITNLTLFLEVDTSHATTILNNLSHWKQVELEKDLVERDRYIIAKR